jgi:hypothetical protein
MVERLMGIVCLAYRLQMQLGQRLSMDPVGQLRRRQWTVTDRVSWFWCGHLLFTDSGYDWRDWLRQQWPHLTQPLATPFAPTLPDSIFAKAA